MRVKIAVGVMLAVTQVAAAQASVRSEFDKIWADRDAAYLAQRDTYQQAAQSSAAKYVAAVKAQGPDQGTTFFAAMQSARDLAEIIGRGKLLSELQAFMKTKPSPAAALAWIQGKVDVIRTESETAVQERAQIVAAKPGQDMPLPQWIGTWEKVIHETGTLIGQNKELALIDQNLGALYQGVGVEQQHAREVRASILRGFAMALAGAAAGAAAARPPQAPVAPVVTPNFNMRCTKYNISTNCQIY